MNEIRRLQELAAQIPTIELATPFERNVAIGAGVAGAAVIGAGAYAFHRNAKKQREWRATAKSGDVLQIAKDLYVDRNGALYPANHPKVVSAKAKE